MIAALFVASDGPYFGIPGVDPWDEARDARLYAGPYPVVAHPPCQRWGKMWAGQPAWIKRTGQRKKKGDDGELAKAHDREVRNNARREVIYMLAEEAADTDPDDLYSGREHRIRNVESLMEDEDDQD